MKAGNWSVAIIAVTMYCSVSYGAADDAWQAAVQQRIEQHRQAEMRIVVLDETGNKVAGAQVEVEQLNHQFLFGCNIFLWGRAGGESDEQQYRQRFAELFNFATVGFYWPSYERRQGEPDHERTERVARWCQEHGIAVKGHPLAWNYSDPSWLPDDPSVARQLQYARITDCVSRFRGLIDRWDVVNEATHFEREEFLKRAPKMTRMWQETGRLEFTKACFEQARAANPAATLLINDYRADEAYEKLIEQLVDGDGKPLYDVIGIQSHMHGGTWPNGHMRRVCDRFARFGVPLHFTETTILSGKAEWRGERRAEPWPSTEEREIWQADEVERFYTMLFSHPAVEAITWWDFSDRNAWQGAPAGYLRADMTPKPAYDRLLGLVKGKWWTRVAGSSDADGRYAFRGFLGQYRLTVKAEGFRAASLDHTLAKGENTVEIRLVRQE